jgi:hypothetical protein
MKIKRSLVMGIVFLTTFIPCVSLASSQNDLKIFCMDFKSLERDIDGYPVGEYEIASTWMKISFERHCIWPASCEEIDFSVLNLETEEDQSFCVINIIDGEPVVIGESKLPLYSSGTDLSDAMAENAGAFILNQDLAEYLVNNVMKERKSDSFDFEKGWMANKIEYCYNDLGQHIYSRCDLDHRYLVTKYKRTRDGYSPCLWAFKRDEYEAEDGKKKHRSFSSVYLCACRVALQDGYMGSILGLYDK